MVLTYSHGVLDLSYVEARRVENFKPTLLKELRSTYTTFLSVKCKKYNTQIQYVTSTNMMEKEKGQKRKKSSRHQEKSWISDLYSSAVFAVFALLSKTVSTLTIYKLLLQSIYPYLSISIHVHNLCRGGVLLLAMGFVNVVRSRSAQHHAGYGCEEQQCHENKQNDHIDRFTIIVVRNEAT